MEDHRHPIVWLDSAEAKYVATHLFFLEGCLELGETLRDIYVN